MKKIVFIFLMTISFIGLYCQTVQNVNSVQEGNKIRVNYQISNVSSDQNMKINIYYSLNNAAYIGPIQKIVGDVGNNILGNGNKSAIWDVLSEIGSIDADMKFKVEVIPTTIVPEIKAEYDGITLTLTSSKLVGADLVFEFRIVSNKEQDKDLCRYKGKLFDALGNEYQSTNCKISTINGGSTSDHFLPNVEKKLKVTFSAVNTEVNNYKILRLHSNSFEFKDLIITR